MEKALIMPLAVRSDKFTSIDTALQSAVENDSVLGAVAMGCTSDGLVYEGSAGKANIETGSPVTPDNVFWLLSMTKTFTAEGPHVDEPLRRSPEDDQT